MPGCNNLSRTLGLGLPASLPVSSFHSQPHAWLRAVCHACPSLSSKRKGGRATYSAILVKSESRHDNRARSLLARWPPPKDLWHASRNRVTITLGRRTDGRKDGRIGRNTSLTSELSFPIPHQRTFLRGSRLSDLSVD